MNFENIILETKNNNIDKENKEKENYEEQLLDFTEDLIFDEDAHKGMLLGGLKGIDSDRAWELRKQVLKSGFGAGGADLSFKNNLLKWF